MHTPGTSGGSVKDCDLMVNEIVQTPLRIKKTKKTENKKGLDK